MYGFTKPDEIEGPDSRAADPRVRRAPVFVQQAGRGKREYSGDARIWQLGAARDDLDNQDTGETQPYCPFPHQKEANHG